MKDIKNSFITILVLAFYLSMNSCAIRGPGSIEYDWGQDVAEEIAKEVSANPDVASWGIIVREPKDSVYTLTLFRNEGQMSKDPLNLVLSRSNRFVKLEGCLIPLLFPSDLDFAIDFGSKEAERVFPFIHGLEIKFVGSGAIPKVIQVSKSG
jgi:hypothetical protein